MISKRFGRIKPSPTMSLIARAHALRAEGVDLVDLGAGQPDYPVHPVIIDATAKAMAEGRTGYGPAGGLPPLREAVAQRYNRRHGSSYGSANVLISSGAKGALYHLLGALVDPGDEVIVPSPFFVSYPEQVGLWEGVPCLLPCREENGFLHTLEDLEGAIGPKTKGILLNTPHNPTGAVIPRDLLEGTLEIAEKNGLFVAFDDVYERFVYEGEEHVCISDLVPEPSEGKPFYVVGSFAKTFSMTGFRLGYIIGPEQGIAGALRIQAHSITSAVTFTQYGAMEAMAREDEIFGTHLEEFAARRELFHEGLSALPDLSLDKAPGAFFAFPNVRGWMGRVGVDSVDDLCGRLLEEARVVTVPGSAFGIEGYLRISYAASDEVIREGLRRIKDFLG
jgi:aspartate aminotransferase